MGLKLHFSGIVQSKWIEHLHRIYLTFCMKLQQPKDLIDSNDFWRKILQWGFLKNSGPKRVFLVL